MTTPHFFDWLYETCSGGKLEVRSVPSGERAWADLGDWRTFGSFVSTAVSRRQNVYFSLATRQNASHGGAGNVREYPALIVDGDDFAAIRQRLDGYPFQPSLVVETSPGRSQLYWKLRGEPLDVSTPAGLRRVAALTRRLSGFLGGDPQATSPAITPRLPNSRNYKYSPPAAVTVIHESDTVVNPSELEDFLPQEVVVHGRLRIEGWIPRGQRASSLWRVVRSLRHTGLSDEVIAKLAVCLDQECFVEPLPVKEFSEKLKRALTKPDDPEFVLRQHARRPRWNR